MKKIILTMLTLLFTLSTFSQIQRRRGGDNRLRIPDQPPTETQIERFKKKAENDKQEYILKFLEKLEADEFQKEIIKSSINDYFTKLEDFSKIPYSTNLERKEAYELFKKEHFAELKTLISENDMKKITDLIEGNNEEENDDKKKKKRKKRKRNKRNKDKEDDSNDNDN